MNHDHCQPGMHKPAPESHYRDEDDGSSHSRHHGRAHHNHQAVEPGGDHEKQPPPISIDHDRAAVDHHGEHGTHLGHGGHGDHAAQFRDRFWLSLVLTIPVVIFSGMVADLLGYRLPDFVGADWIPPVLGTVIFLYGGAPFLTGAWAELKQRQPGMMLLIAMAITVAFIASWATTLGLFDLDFWWELALLIVIMLLGHWLEMRALGAASGALEALAALLPDIADKITPEGVVEVPVAALAADDVVLVRSGARVPADGAVVSGCAAGTNP
jgi:P-type Cu2+ transporter